MVDIIGFPNHELYSFINTMLIRTEHSTGYNTKLWNVGNNVIEEGPANHARQYCLKHMLNGVNNIDKKKKYIDY